MIVLGVDFDVVVNVDGFNELAIGISDASLGFHPIFPSRAHTSGVLALQGHQLTTDDLLMAAEVERLHRRIDTLRRRVARDRFLGRFELAQAIAGNLVQREQRRAVEVEKRLQGAVQESETSTIAVLTDPCLKGAGPVGR